MFDVRESRSSRRDAEDRTEEADKVSARITEILTEQTFNFSPAYLSMIHRRLFSGIFNNAGEYRQYNITKKEWVLDGDTVLYSPYEMIGQTLEYDFREEKQVDYSSLNAEDAIKRISKFISGLWQIHPFCEGNTRTASVFAIKYLRNFGFAVDNELFADNSWYFRNALVRANYTNFSKGVKATDIFLVQFFQNLILGTSHILRKESFFDSNGNSRSYRQVRPNSQKNNVLFVRKRAPDKGEWQKKRQVGNTNDQNKYMICANNLDNRSVADGDFGFRNLQIG